MMLLQYLVSSAWSSEKQQYPLPKLISWQAFNGHKCKVTPKN
uniref:Uncharacterized protein n=1 Tax=Rhizophora mucronata TaxID=61149 RepID=A0A2P2PFW7_RHIMU